MQVNISTCAFSGEEDAVQLLTLDILSLCAGRDCTLSLTMHTMVEPGGIL